MQMKGDTNPNGVKGFLFTNAHLHYTMVCFGERDHPGLQATNCRGDNGNE